nr:hypothetical protein [Tanacetum cinerariifolium]
MNNKKRIVNLEYFIEMLQICPRIPNQPFDELPFEEEILAFLKELGHSREIKMITDVEHKDAKKSNEMYYPRFTKVIVNFFMTKDQSIPRRNKVNWHFSRDDHMFNTIKLVSRHQNTQQYGAILPIELTNEAIRNFKSYKEYYVIASGAKPPKTKASVDKLAKEKQPAKTSKAKGLTVLSKVALAEDEKSSEEEDDDDDEVKISEHDDDVDDQSDDDDDDEQTNLDNEGDDFVHPKFSTLDDEDKEEESPDTGIDSIFESTPRVYVPVMTTVEPRLLSATTLPPPFIPIISHVQQTPAPSPANVPSLSLQDLPNFGSLFGFDHRLKTLETNFLEFMQTNYIAEAISSIIGIVDNSKIEKTVNEQIEAEVLTRSSISSKTSHDVAADLSELELKKILIDKIESNKSIHRSDEQKNLYKALVDAYEFDKLILDTYGDTVTLKRRQDDEDKDEEPSAGSNWGSKRRRVGKEPESTSAPKEKTSKTSGKSTEGSKSHHKTTSESAPAEEPMYITQDLEEPAHQEFETGATDDQPVEEASQHPHCNLAKKADSRTSFNELMDTPVDFSTFATTDQLDWNNPEEQQYPNDLLKPLPLIPNSQGHRVIPFDHFINNDLEYLRGGVSSRKYTTSVTKTKAADSGHIKWIKDLVPCTMWIQIPCLLANVHKKHRHPTACGRSLIMCPKLPKKLNLAKRDTYISDLKRKEAYTANSNPRGFIYQNKDKQNRLMHIDELHNFSDGTLNDVRIALDDRLKGIRMKYLP